MKMSIFLKIRYRGMLLTYSSAATGAARVRGRAVGKNAEAEATSARRRQTIRAILVTCTHIKSIASKCKQENEDCTRALLASAQHYLRDTRILEAGLAQK